MYSQLRNAQAFWDKVDMTPNPTLCWIWRGPVNADGYGRFTPGSSTQKSAHRVTYEEVFGPIPTGLQLDHRCRNRTCVNPLHLEPVTARENVMRGNGRAAINARKTHCVAGHEYTPANTYHSKGGHRSCRACKRDWNRTTYGHGPRIRKAQCLRGHPLAGDNLYFHRGRRRCRECMRYRNRLLYHKAKVVA